MCVRGYIEAHIDYNCAFLFVRPTVVHRFLVRGTIEERIFNLLETVDVPLECHDSEQSTLTIGQLNQLFTEPGETEIGV